MRHADLGDNNVTEEQFPECDLGDIDLDDEAFVHACDEKRFENSFIYCRGKLLEARK